MRGLFLSRYVLTTLETGVVSGPGARNSNSEAVMSLSVLRTCIGLAFCVSTAAHASIPSTRGDLLRPVHAQTQAIKSSAGPQVGRVSLDTLPWGNDWLQTIGSAYKASCTSGRSLCEFHEEEVHKTLEDGLLKVRAYLEFYVRPDGSYAVRASLVSTDWRVPAGEQPVIIADEVLDKFGTGIPNEYWDGKNLITDRMAQQNLRLIYHMVVGDAFDRALDLNPIH
jgi:hypothetical protein